LERDRRHVWIRRTQARGEPSAREVARDVGRLLEQVTVPVGPTFVLLAARGDLIGVVMRADEAPTVVYDIVRGRRSDARGSRR
jgi:hypothetical protein